MLYVANLCIFKGLAVAYSECAINAKLEQENDKNKDWLSKYQTDVKDILTPT